MPSRTPSWTVSWVTSNRSSMKGSAAPQRSLARDELTELEQPDAELKLSRVPFHEPCIDERPDQAMDRRLGQTGFRIRSARVNVGWSASNTPRIRSILPSTELSSFRSADRTCAS